MEINTYTDSFLNSMALITGNCIVGTFRVFCHNNDRFPQILQLLIIMKPYRIISVVPKTFLSMFNLTVGVGKLITKIMKWKYIIEIKKVIVKINCWC